MKLILSLASIQFKISDDVCLLKQPCLAISIKKSHRYIIYRLYKQIIFVIIFNIDIKTFSLSKLNRTNCKLKPPLFESNCMLNFKSFNFFRTEI